MKTQLFDVITQLRAMASSIYDRSVEAELKKEEVAANLKPIQNMLNQHIDAAIENNVEGCVMAIRLLEAQAQTFEDEIKFLREKMSDAKAHAEAIKAKLRDRMMDDGKNYLAAGGFVVTLGEDGAIKVR